MKGQLMEHPSPAAPTTGGPAAPGWDLLSVPPVRWLLTSRLYPGVLQGLSVVVFGLIFYFAFFGTIRPGQNLATVVTWTLWWPLLPLSLLLLGRVWCAICPFTLAIDGVQRLARPHRLPGPQWRRLSVGVMGLTFFLLTLVERLWGITGSPQATGWLLLALLIAAVAMAVLYRRRAFCRLVCPIGALTGLYAMTAVSEVRSKGGSCQGCHQLCYRGKGNEGCPLYEFPRTMDSNRNCNLCAQCIKDCPQDNLTWQLRPPGRELWGVRHPLTAEALLVTLLVALVYIQTVDMTTGWGSYVKWAMERGPTSSYNTVLVGTFLIGSLVVIGAYLLISRLSASGGSWTRNAARYGYAYLPVVLAVHLAHNAGHLVIEGGAAVKTALANIYSLVGMTYAVDYGTGSPSFSMSWMTGAVALGGLFSMYSAWRVGRGMERRGEASRLLPHLLFLLLLTALFIHLFLLPMNPRHTH